MLQLEKFCKFVECKLKILLVEDQEEIATLLQGLLQRENYVVDIAPDLAYAKEAVELSEYSVVLLDRMLPDGEGMDLISFVKHKHINCRFLILSALGDIESRVKGLDIGADDYIVKPFEPEELLARIRAAIRRPMPEELKTWTFGCVEMEQHSKNVKIGEKFVAFPRRELIILEALIKSAGRVVTRPVLEEALYGYDDEIMSNSLESHISRLRKKMDGLGAGVVIHAVRGVGYLMKEGQ